MYSYCTTLCVGIGGIGGGISISKMLKFSAKVFYVIGKALSGEVSCMQLGLVISSYYTIDLGPVVQD